MYTLQRLFILMSRIINEPISSCQLCQPGASLLQLQITSSLLQVNFRLRAAAGVRLSDGGAGGQAGAELSGTAVDT